MQLGLMVGVCSVIVFARRRHRHLHPLARPLKVGDARPAGEPNEPHAAGRREEQSPLSSQQVAANTCCASLWLANKPIHHNHLFLHHHHDGPTTLVCHEEARNSLLLRPARRHSARARSAHRPTPTPQVEQLRGALSARAAKRAIGLRRPSAINFRRARPSLAPANSKQASGRVSYCWQPATPEPPVGLPPAARFEFPRSSCGLQGRTSVEQLDKETDRQTDGRTDGQALGEMDEQFRLNEHHFARPLARSLAKC